ncbi:MAG: hypothetical protein MSH60_12200, partial [Ruminococcus sp.]|nr:hypothetical protein [Ruminococcus sp.]
MMNHLKKNFALLSAAAVCLGLSACGGGDIGGDWRTWGIIQSDGTITRNGEDTYVLVCVNKKASNFYYDTDGQTLFDGVEYPPALADKLAPAEDVWAMYKSTDFSDLNGDGNTDVTMWFDDNGSEIKAVWFWDTENGQFIFQPNESNLGDEGRGDIDIGGGDDDVGGGDDDIGADWRTWGIIQSSGTITRNGEDTEVMVCVNKKASNFYYDTDSQTLFDGVEYPP